MVGSLASITDLVASKPIAPPAVTIIGDVVRAHSIIRERTLYEGR